MSRSYVVCALLAFCFSLTATAKHRTAQPGPPAYHATITSDHTIGEVREVILSNGLKILLKEDHAAPVATFVVYYKVGSRNEHVGITGSAHLLEHLQFKGSKNFPSKSAIWGGLSHIGANFNATTAQDRTNYYETVPIEQLPFAIKLEADRMRNSIFTDQDRASEMTVVRNELERGENEPGRLTDNLTWETSFISHPYHHPVIGWRSDVENVPTSELRAFYNTFYQPDNAVVVAVGDFKSDDVLKQIVDNFGVLPGGHQFPPVYTKEEIQRGERRAFIRKPGEISLVELGWHLPALGSPDVVPLKVLQLILAGTLQVNEFGEPLTAGISNRLYQGLVETQIATGVDMTYQLMLNETLGSITVELRPGVPHWKAEDAIRSALSRVKNEPVSDAELQRAKNRARAAFALSQDGTFGQAMALGYFGLLGDWRFVQNFSDLVDKVTAADVQRVARTYFTDDDATVVWFVPQEQPAMSPPPPPAGKQTSSLNIHPHRWAALRDSDDFAAAQAVTARALAARAEAEEAGGKNPNAMPTPKKRTLPNGLRIVVLETHTNPTFALSGSILAGSALEKPEDLGLAGVTADMMERGTAKHTKLQLASELEEVGASYGIEGGFETVGIGALALKDNLDRVLDVMSEELLTPTFPEDELKKEIAEQIAYTKDAEDSTAVKARRALMQALYPKGHPFYIDNPDDVIKSLQAMTPQRVRQWYEKFYGPDRTIITIVGDVKAEDVFSRIESRLGGWKKVGGPPVEAPAVPINTQPRRIDIQVPDKANVDIIEGIQGTIRRTDPGYYPVMLANYVLGGGVTSRLFAQVRNEMGLTYGIGSGLSASLLAGPWTVSLTVNPGVIDKSLGAVRSVTNDWYQKGITEEELKNAKTEITGLYKVSLGNNRGLASVMNEYEVLGLGAEYVREHPKRIMAVTLDQVNTAIKQAFHPDALVTVVSGTIPGKGSESAPAGTGP